MKLLQAIIAIIFIIITSSYSEVITDYLIGNNILGWFTSFISPAVLTLVLILFLSRLTYTNLNLNRTYKLITSVLTFSGLVGFYLFLNLPYVEDYSAYGTEINISNNSIIKDVCDSTDNYNGVLMIASVSCPHCMASAENLSILQNRVPSRDIQVILYTESQEQVENFKQNSGVYDLTYNTTKSEKDALELCDGRFPTFIYIKNGKAIHKWRNSEFGFPAYDRVESGLE